MKGNNRMKVIVVGGGAAGMMAAIAAAESGHQVELLERNEKLGKKNILQEKEDVMLPMLVIWKNFLQIL